MDSSDSPPCQIPIVDFGKLVDTDVEREGITEKEAEFKSAGKELAEALSGVGFVYLSNHGVAEDQINNIFCASSAFFSLPEKTKTLYDVNLNSQHGYDAIDRERLDKSGNLTELREGFYMSKLKGPFPDAEVPQLRPSAAAFVASCKALAHRVLAALALGLGLEWDFFVSAHRNMCDGTEAGLTVLRVNHYPPLPGPVPENAIRCGAHSDYGSITLLFQDSMGGLQVRGLDGRWVDAKPVPGTVLINAGDLLHVWTAGRVVATKHRVIIPEEEKRLRASRLSAAFFVHPDAHVLVQPIDGSSSPPPINARQHLQNMYDKTYRY